MTSEQKKWGGVSIGLGDLRVDMKLADIIVVESKQRLWGPRSWWTSLPCPSIRAHAPTASHHRHYMSL